VRARTLLGAPALLVRAFAPAGHLSRDTGAIGPDSGCANGRLKLGREPLPGHYNAIRPRVGDKHWDRRCTVSPMASASSLELVLSSVLHPAGLAEVILEYLLGFGFGWTVFQALFMRDTTGGSYPRALKSTFAPELLSMNFLMSGMVSTVMTIRRYVSSACDLSTPNLGS
jgi:hypothetical protein